MPTQTEQTYGPNHAAVAAHIERIRVCTTVEIEALATAWDTAWSAARDTARDTAWDAAWSAARYAARYAARDAARDAARGAARDAARDAARGAAWGAAWDAAWDAAYALVVSDLVAPDVFETLYGPWRSVIDEQDYSAYASRRDARTCPCAGRCRGCQCPCEDCTAVREAREAEMRITCTRCHEARPESDFSIRTNGRRQSWCRECTATYNRERRATRTTGPATATSNRASRRATVNTGRKFGVELEVIDSANLGQSQAARLLRNHGLDVRSESYGHETRAHWKIVPDGSVSAGFEIVSPILQGVEGRRELRKMCEALRAIGCTVNGSCGFHVHHDVSDLTGAAFYRLAQIWQGSQRIIDGLVSPSRRGGRSNWARDLGPFELDQAERVFRQYGTVAIGTRQREIARDIYGDRYRSLNWQSFGRQGTIEIRQHQGTLNATKALAWVTFGQALIEQAVAEASSGTYAPVTTIAELVAACESHGLEPTTAAYLLDRHRAFSREAVAA